MRAAVGAFFRGTRVTRAPACLCRAHDSRQREQTQRRAETSVDGRGYQVTRWSNSKAGADRSSGSADGSCSTPVASHNGGPRAGVTLAL